MPKQERYHPETLLFVIDVCEDPGIEYAKYATRLELLKHCIGCCAQAKSRLNPSHKFGLAVVRDSVQWEGAGVTTSAEGLLTALRGVQPSPPSGSGVAAPRPLDLSAIVSLVKPLAVAEEADGCKVRVVFVFCRSSVLPVWTSRNRPGEALCMDVLFVHDKAAAATAAAWPGCASPQEIYTWLEDSVDELSGRCGHHAYIFEAGGHITRKVINIMASLVAHPAQRPPQRALRPAPLDLSTVPHKSTSATASSSSKSMPPIVTGAAAASSESSAMPSLQVAAAAPSVVAPLAMGSAAGAAPAPSAWGVVTPTTQGVYQTASAVGHHPLLLPVKGKAPPQPSLLLPPQPLNLIDLTSSTEISFSPQITVTSGTAVGTAMAPWPSGGALPPRSAPDTVVDGTREDTLLEPWVAAARHPAEDPFVLP